MTPTNPTPELGTLARSALWKAAAALFRHPDEEPAAEVGSAAFWEALLPSAGRIAEPALEAAFARARAAFEGRTRESLEEEHARAFGHTVRSPAPLYETLWGSEGSLLQPHTIADLAAFYRAHGLRVAAGGERPDHLAVECEFLHFLAYKEAYATARGETERAEECRETRGGFLHEHLGRFAPAFALRLRKEAGTGPFLAAADFLAELVRSEAAALRVRTGAEELPLRTISFEDEAGCVSCPLGGAAGPAVE